MLSALIWKACSAGHARRIQLCKSARSLTFDGCQLVMSAKHGAPDHMYQDKGNDRQVQRHLKEIAHSAPACSLHVLVWVWHVVAQQSFVRALLMLLCSKHCQHSSKHLGTLLRC